MRRTLILLLALLSFVTVEARASSIIKDSKSQDLNLEEFIELGLPIPVSASWTELVVDIPVRIRPIGVRGRIDRFVLHDLTFNGIPFQIDPHEAAFELPQRFPYDLPKPIRVRLAYRTVAPGLITETLVPKKTLRVKGTASIEGTFRKWIFSSHRTVQVPIDVTRPNPLADYHPLEYVVEKLKSFDGIDLDWPF